MAAAARIHRRDQHEARRIGDAMIGARDRDFAGLERLAQRVERVRLEFRQLVEKQHAVMGERNFAGPCVNAAADQSRHARGMMRRAERPPIGERAAFDLAGDRGDHRHFEQFGRRQRRQDRGQTRSEHRFAGARRSDHEQIVAASCCHFERALGALLAFDVGKIERGPVTSRIFGCGRDSTCVPLKWFASWINEEGAMISISGLAQAASGRRPPDTSGPRRAHWRRWRRAARRRPARSSRRDRARRAR